MSLFSSHGLNYMSIIVDAFTDKYSLSGIGGMTLSVLADLPSSVKLFVSLGTILIISFNVWKSYEQAKLASIQRKTAEKKLEE